MKFALIALVAPLLPSEEMLDQPTNQDNLVNSEEEFTIESPQPDSLLILMISS